MRKSVTTWSLRPLLIAAISVAVVALPVVSAFSDARILASPLTEGEDQTGGEEDGNGFDKIELCADSEAALHLAPVVCVVCHDDASIDLDAHFLIGHLERGPPV